MDPLEKKFKLKAEELRDIAPGLGACFATDSITVDGHKVAFMYREDPDNDMDSGWRFLSGLESEEYMDNADNHAIYDVNTIANYDSEIVPFLNMPYGTAFERPDGVGNFEQVFDFDPSED